MIPPRAEFSSGPGVILAAPSSGSGKTLVTLGLLAHLTARGIRVASVKVGPDYLDPAFHAAATGRDCPNLDSWAMRGQTAAGIAHEASISAEIVLCEGVMGLFDGADVPVGGPTGSTAEIALLTGWPVVMVLDARAMAASAAAVLAGFVHLQPRLRIAGVIFNRVSTERHRRMIAAACALHCPEVRLLGFLPTLEALRLPSRHLGLVQAREHPDLATFLATAAAAVAIHVDVAGLVALAQPLRLPAEAPPMPLPPLGRHISVARDDAFAFAYPTVLEGWRRQGAEVSFFSPLADESPQGTAVYLPGGYPELHAGKLAQNQRFFAGLSAIAAAGGTVYGECGGYMVLGRRLVDKDGHPHAMAGLLPLETSFAQPRRQLGYRHAKVATACPLGGVGTPFRGHAFHFSTVLTEEGPSLFETSDAAERENHRAGLCLGTVMGSFVHLVDRA